MSRAFSGITLVLGIMALGSALPTPLYVLYQRQFHFSEIVLTFVFAIYICGAIGGLMFFGKLSDQIGRRRVLWMSLAAAALSTVTFVFITNRSLLFVGRVLSGFAVAIGLSTATAYLAELQVHGDKRQATRSALVANMLAQFEFQPRRLSFFVYFGLLAAAALIVWFAPETVKSAAKPISLRPRLGVPTDKWREFLSPATTGFCIFSVLGLFSALAPTLLSKQLHQTGHALAGAVVFEIYAIGALTAWLFRTMVNLKAMLTGECIIFPHLALLLVSMKFHSLALLLAATAIGGIAMGLGFKGSLEVVNMLAPAEHRSEVLAQYYLITYSGLALPVIGVGIIAQLIGPFVANLTFSSVIAALAAVAVITGLKFRPQTQAQ